MKRTLEEKKQRRALNLFFSLVIFGILWISILLAAAIMVLLIYFGVYPYQEVAALEHTGNAYSLMWFTVLISLVIGSTAAFITTKFSMNPVGHLVTHINRLASGDYKARMEPKDFMSDTPAFRPVTESINKLAEELQNTEMLRSDFINNFSHEFKTPIVSIAGFTKLLKRGNLTEEQRQEYLDIIEEESMRLSAMATNVLNMTRIENQTILTDAAAFNVSEQIRSAILLLDEKWDRKHIELSADFSEYTITGNEEMLKQVWINLLDNAVKFTPDFGSVRVELSESDGKLTVSITNTGSTIPPEKLPRIWNKFYQADESHAAAGNGIGLAIVKKVTELHKGEVKATSANDLTTFTVILPLKI
ncbi:MAG: HAMP domain-containing histidine kinase [Clostridia bacterium]|nr:HAMP domain-containing histidine kinase [Clostridia bacterium]